MLPFIPSFFEQIFPFVDDRCQEQVTRKDSQLSCITFITGIKNTGPGIDPDLYNVSDFMWNSFFSINVSPSPAISLSGLNFPCRTGMWRCPESCRHRTFHMRFVFLMSVHSFSPVGEKKKVQRHGTWARHGTRKWPRISRCEASLDQGRLRITLW